jgi:fluoride exporter
VIYLWIAFGSGIGGVCRYVLGGWVARQAGAAFPWGTLLVNILGCTFIGWFAAMTGPDGRILASTRTRQFVMVGICGGFTTFSSFSLETLNLLRDGEAGRAVANMSLSVGLCMLGVWLGHLLATTMNR